MNSTFTAEQELKLYLLARGIKIEEGAEQAWIERYGGPLSLVEYASTSGIAVYTQNGVYINAPFVEAFTAETQAEFRHDDSRGFHVSWEGALFPVSVIPVPAYHNLTWQDGGVEKPYTDIGVTHTDRVRISPIEGCAWVCFFCDLPFEHRHYRKKPLQEMHRVIELAVNDPQAPARHVLISGGTPKPEDEAWIDEVYASLAGMSPIPVDVMMPARHDMSYPAWLRSVGVNALSCNIEVWDEARARRVVPNKARLLGRSHYLHYIEAAVEAFGVGFAQSLILIGAAIEPLESSLEGIQALAERGCIPVLSPFRPDHTTPMGRQPPASVEEMRQAYEESIRICEESGTGVKPGPRCIACHHNTVAFPDGSRFYVGLGEDLATRSWG